MKLQTKINYRFLALLLAVFLLAGVILYVVFGMLVDDNLDETLLNRSLKIKQNLSKNPSTALMTESMDQSITIVPITRSTIPAIFSVCFIIFHRLICSKTGNGKYQRSDN